jgi:hypothetical protein
MRIILGYTIIKAMAISGVLDGVNGDYNTLGFKYSDPLVWGPAVPSRYIR